MTIRLLRTKRNDGNKTKKDKGKNLNGIKKRTKCFRVESTRTYIFRGKKKMERKRNRERQKIKVTERNRK
jgi:hypothetical protein